MTTTKSMDMTDMKVIRRDGLVEDYDISKIRNMIDFATKGLDVNPIELEGKFNLVLKDRTSTEEIQETLIECALSLCDSTEPDWRYVAGRLLSWNHIKNNAIKYGNKYGNDFLFYIGSKINQGVYNPILFKYYTSEELFSASLLIEPSRDYDYDYAGMTKLLSSYINDDELVQQVYLICALYLASPDFKYTELSSEDKLLLVKAIYDALSLRKISLATPVLKNLRYEEGSLSSCFIFDLEDNSESILQGIVDAGHISRNNGGLGIRVSNIRALGAEINGYSNRSNGITPFIKLFNDVAIAFDQGKGKGKRAGAFTIALDVWHNDLLDFLELQKETGEQRFKSHDVFPQVVINDLFMERVVEAQNWILICPYEVKKVFGYDLANLWGDEFKQAYTYIEENLDLLRIKTIINPRRILIKIIESLVETGLPYIAFKDTINQANPNRHEGIIPCGNLCMESYSVVKPHEYTHVCNLTSLNLANITDFADLSYYAKLTVRILDNTIELTHPPTKPAAAHNERYRTIGVGIMGLADWIAKNSLSYKSPELYTHLHELFNEFAYSCISASIDLAIERGQYPAFEGSQWSKGLLSNGYTAEELALDAEDLVRWKQLSEDVMTYGIRNSHLMMIAPNTSTSLIQGCTASILPAYNKFYYDKYGEKSVPIAPPFIKEYFWYYLENKYIHPHHVIDMVSIMQKYVDTGISMEQLWYIKNPDAYIELNGQEVSAADIYQAIIYAWRKKLKTIYYIRTVEKDILSVKTECESCAS